jgi:uncharacterized protein (DUF1015 family)
VISEEEQGDFYNAHPYNMIRLVLGKTYADDTSQNNRYTRAASTLQSWLMQGVLTKSDKPGYMVYQMDYESPDGGRKVIDGVIALVKVDDYGKGKVLPHEKTYKGPKEDQLKLTRSCRAHLTPIHALFDDRNDKVKDLYKGVMENRPDQEAVDAEGAIHRAWVLDDQDTIQKIAEKLEQESIFIADGHHRYETARAYKQEMDERVDTNGKAAHDYVMMYLTPLTHPGLLIRPAHRMVKGLDHIDINGFLKRVRPCFETDSIYFDEDSKMEAFETLMKRIRGHEDIGGKFGVYVGGEKCFRLFRLKDFSCVDQYIDPSIPGPLRSLDVTVLREVVIARGLRLDREEVEGHIEYTPSPEKALEYVDKGKVQISFIINPTRVDQMRAAAEVGHRLPQKSTFFYPKVCSGLVMNVF